MLLQDLIGKKVDIQTDVYQQISKKLKDGTVKYINSYEFSNYYIPRVIVPENFSYNNSSGVFFVHFHENGQAKRVSVYCPKDNKFILGDDGVWHKDYSFAISNNTNFIPYTKISKLEDITEKGIWKTDLTSDGFINI